MSPLVHMWPWWPSESQQSLNVDKELGELLLRQEVSHHPDLGLPVGVHHEGPERYGYRLPNPP